MDGGNLAMVVTPCHERKVSMRLQWPYWYEITGLLLHATAITNWSTETSETAYFK